MLTRRLFLTAVAAGAALPAGLAPRRVWAGTRLEMGAGVTLDTLSDGTLLLPREAVVGGLPEAEVAAILAAAGITGDSIAPPCNVTLLRDGTNTVLFDAGSGPDFQPTAGKLPEALAALGLAPEAVTHVVFTHGHPDHLWGVLDEFGEPLFPAAAHVMGRIEADYWTDPATPAALGEARASFAVGAARRIAALGEALRRVEDGEAVLPGVTARLTDGHTPGHLAFEIALGGGRAMVVGDAIGNHHAAFARPDWHLPLDQDPPRAAATRRALLTRLAAEGTVFSGFHLPEGGIGRAVTEGEGFRFAPL